MVLGVECTDSDVGCVLLGVAGRHIDVVVQKCLVVKQIQRVGLASSGRVSVSRRAASALRCLVRLGSFVGWMRIREAGARLGLAGLPSFAERLNYGINRLRRGFVIVRRGRVCARICVARRALESIFSKSRGNRVVDCRTPVVACRVV